MKRIVRTLLTAGIAAAMLSAAVVASGAAARPAGGSAEQTACLDTAALWKQTAEQLTKEAARNCPELDTDALWSGAAAGLAGRLVPDTDGGSYTVLEKAMDYARQFRQGSWNAELSLRGSASASGGCIEAELPLEADVSAVFQDGRVSDWTVTKGAGMTEAFRKEFGAFYGRMGGVDWRTLLDEFTEKVRHGGLFDADGECVAGWGQYQDAPARAEEIRQAHEQAFTEAVRELAAALEDGSFTRDGSDYSCTITRKHEAAQLSLTLTLHTQDGAVTGYRAELKAGMAGEDAASVTASLEQDAKGAISGKLRAGLDGGAAAEATLTGRVTRVPAN